MEVHPRRDSSTKDNGVSDFVPTTTNPLLTWFQLRVPGCSRSGPDDNYRGCDVSDSRDSPCVLTPTLLSSKNGSTEGLRFPGCRHPYLGTPRLCAPWSSGSSRDAHWGSSEPELKGEDVGIRRILGYIEKDGRGRRKHFARNDHGTLAPVSRGFRKESLDGGRG